ncbi:MAG: GNAT family N-acetyltransferase [Acutalibacteraceae bacterium]
METVKTKKDFEDIYKLLSAGFPYDELREKEDFMSLRENPLFKAFVKRESGKITGFIGAWTLEGFVYAEYFVVASEKRGEGLGSAMLREFLDTVNQPVCLEVEPPETSGIAVRRIGFYERMGFVENGYEYYQPPYSPKKKPLRLIIMTSPVAISEDEFERYRASIYKNVYGGKTLK